MPEGYIEQVRLECCWNCVSHDFDADDILFCLATKEAVDCIGICDGFELDITED